jgi:hypothetical protein
VSSTGYPSTEAAVSAFETAVGRKLDVHRWYALWDQTMPPPSVMTSIQRGRTPVLSISSKKVDGTKISWAAIARGDHDARIVEQAKAIGGLGVPIFLTFQHEPDYATGYGTAAEYRAAWRHYVAVFRAQGVTNVAWTWIVTPTPFATSPSTATADQLYPGDDVVDWMGLDAYNWYGCSSNGQSSWRTIAQIATPFRTFGQAHGKPLMLAEWGSYEDAADPTRKASWLTESMATLSSWPEMKAVLYFNHTGSCPWSVDSSQQSLAAFTQIAADPAGLTRASAWLRSSSTFGSAPLAVTLDGSRSRGARAALGADVASWSLTYGDGSAAVSGNGRPPAALGHTYVAGTYRATLTVTDSAGATASDTLTITSAPAPTVKVEQKNVTDTSADLYAYADLHGYAGTVRFEWGTTTAYGTSSGAVAVPAVSYVKTVSTAATGLRAGTTYYTRTTATSPAGTTVVTASFGTAGKPTSSTQWTSSSTSTSTTFKAQVNPHRLATSAWLEWGRTASLGSRSATTALPGLTYEKTVSSGLVTGLLPRTTYYYRVVATNALGSLYGPVRTMTTPG